LNRWFSAPIFWNSLSLLVSGSSAAEKVRLKIQAGSGRFSLWQMTAMSGPPHWITRLYALGVAVRAIPQLSGEQQLADTSTFGPQSAPLVTFRHLPPPNLPRFCQHRKGRYDC
jgi:hypothetical protein